MNALALFASRFGRYAVVYASGMAVQLVLGMATTIVIVNYLSPSEYGQLALYLLVPLVVMTTSNLGIMQGTFLVVFGTTGEEGAEIEAPDGEGPIESVDARRALGTGVTLTLVASTVLVGATLALAPLLASGAESRRLIAIGAVSGALAALWRLLSNFFRYARRPVAFAVTQSSRFLFALVFTWLLLAGGRGIEGAIEGFALGTAGALLVTLVAVRNEVRPAFDRTVAREIRRRGSGWIVVSGAFVIIQNLDVLVLSAVATNAEVGVYRLAGNLARTSAYAASVFMYSWGSLLTGPLRVAVEREQGRPRAGGRLVGAYVVLAAGLVLVLGTLADVLVRVAPESFGAAAGLVPVLALMPLCRVLFSAVYATSTLPAKTPLFFRLSAAAVVLFGVLSLVLGPPLEGYGIAVAAAGAFLIPGLILLALTQRGADPLILDPRKLVGAPLLAAALLALVLALDTGVTVAGVAVRIAAVFAYVAALVATGIVPRVVVKALVHPLRAIALPRDRSTIAEAVGRLEPADAQLLFELARKAEPVGAVAAAHQEHEATLLVRLTVVLRQLGGEVSGIPDPVATGEYLLYDGPTASREKLAKRLIDGGMDPLALDQLDVVLSHVKRIPLRRWPLPAR